MHTLLRPGSLVLTLGNVLLIGCTASSDSPTKVPPPQLRVSEDQGKVAKSEKPVATSEAATPREHVLTVEGMT